MPFRIAFIIIAAILVAACGGRTQFGTAECGNLEAEWGEECDGADLNGVTCADLGWSGGSLSCSAGCSFDTGGCSGTGPVCGNGAREYGEQCDGANLGGQSCVSLGLASGTLSCDSSCEFDTTGCYGDVCGNGTVGVNEQCDGADLQGVTCQDLFYQSGTLACAADCRFDESRCVGYEPVCGDGVRHQPQEQCDGADLGGQSCQSLGFDGGALSCTSSCLLDLSQCNAQQPFCGDGLINTPMEECDGADLQGLTCQALGYSSGTLSCTGGCWLDTSQCLTTQPYCGDGMVNTSQEECDGADLQGLSCQALGYDSGSLTCTSGCWLDESQCVISQPYCGDGWVNTPWEECDGYDLQGWTCQMLGYDGGTLSCTNGCWLNESQCYVTQPYCGDGVVNTAVEQCDGADLQGQTCVSQGFAGGTLACTSGCAFNTGGCSTTVSCSPTGGAVACDSGVVGTTYGSPSLVSHWTGCGTSGLTGPETVYSFQLPAGMAAGPVWVGLYNVTASLDVVVVRGSSNGCNPSGTCELVMDNPGTQDEGGDFYAYPGVTYYIVVDGNSGAAGDFVLAIGCFSP
ncbi:MAG: hypothetical protein ABI333_02705 [bacterium]